MSRFCLLILFLGIAVRFGDCENYNIYENDANCITGKPGSEKTRLTTIEKMMNGLGSLNPFKKNKKSFALEAATFSNVLEEAEKYIGIFPGTQWCGNGDNAKNENDLGRFNDTDACCRAHDNCVNNISAGEKKINLINNGIFTRSSCACDFAFYNCLKNAASLPSKTVGKTYFNILRPQCFECLCPTDDCDPNNGTDCKDNCVKYQWTDNSKF